jgi:polysaccharide biosynthesis/export protein
MNTIIWNNTANPQSAKMSALSPLYRIGLTLMIGLLAHVALAQVGRVGMKDTLIINPAKIKLEDVPMLQDKLRSSGGSFDWKDLDRQNLSGSGDEQTGNTLSNQNAKRNLMNEAAKASEMLQNLTEIGSTPLRKGLLPVDVFGFHLFRSKGDLLFNSATDVKAPRNYIIGVGDQLQIIILGFSDYNELFIVDKEGFIQPRYAGRINVKGLTLEDAEKAITRRINQTYNMTSSRVVINLNYSRVITVNVVGEVENPGSYTFPAINTVYNVLAHIGGPLKSGSLRNIQVKRAGKVVATFDLYKYLFSPEMVGDIFLEHNDYIYVPQAGNIVSISGSINKPGKFELLPEERLSDLLTYSGGYTPEAFRGSIQVRRYVSDKMVVIDVDEQNYNGFLLQNGDAVSIMAISQEPRNYVRIHGPVYLPGVFEAVDGMKFMDVVDKAQGFMPEVLLSEAYMLRVNDDFTRTVIKINPGNALRNRQSADNVLIEGRDEIIIFSQNQFYDASSVSISGAVREPKSYPLLFGMSLRDLIMMSGGLNESALLEQAVIYRTLPTLEEEAIYVQLDTANNLAALDNIFLEPKDKVRIFAKITHLDTHTIRVHGLVRTPGILPFRRNMTLTDAILSCGGMQATAAYNRIEVSRILSLDSVGASTPSKVTIATIQVVGDIATDGQANSFVLQPYDEIFVREMPNFRFQQSIVIAGEVNYPGAYPLTSKVEQLTAVIERAGGLTPYAFARGATLLRRTDPDKGLLIMNLEEAMRRKKSRYNYILRDGDSIFIPITMDYVTLKGSIEHPDIKEYGSVNVPFEEGRNAKYYVNRYGTGFSSKANAKKTVVTYPNREARNSNFVFFGRKYPRVENGSVIYVPDRNYLTNKEKKQNRPEKDKTDREKIVQTVVTSLTSTLTMFLLIFTTVR